MQIRTLFQSRSLSIMDYRCDAGPHDKSSIELFPAHSISYVRAGSFGCCSRGRSYELVPGSLLIGHSGDEYQCTHDHHAGGDECLSFQLAPEFVDSVGANSKIWRVGSVPPLPELMILGELAQSAAHGRSGISAEEVGLVLTQRFIDVQAGVVHSTKRSIAGQRRRAVEAALWIDAHSHDDIGLDDIARAAELSPFHFLRLFASVFNVTPHQYLLRSRLRRAVHLLADDSRSITAIAYDAGFNDLSNFVRTFHRAAGMSPGRFRLASRGQRKIFQERLKPIV